MSFLPGRGVRRLTRTSKGERLPRDRLWSSTGHPCSPIRGTASPTRCRRWRPQYIRSSLPSQHPSWWLDFHSSTRPANGAPARGQVPIYRASPPPLRRVRVRSTRRIPQQSSSDQRSDSGLGEAPAQLPPSSLPGPKTDVSVPEAAVVEGPNGTATIEPAPAQSPKLPTNPGNDVEAAATQPEAPPPGVAAGPVGPGAGATTQPDTTLAGPATPANPAPPIGRTTPPGPTTPTGPPPGGGTEPPVQPGRPAHAGPSDSTGLDRANETPAAGNAPTAPAGPPANKPSDNRGIDRANETPAAGNAPTVARP